MHCFSLKSTVQTLSANENLALCDTTQHLGHTCTLHSVLNFIIVRRTATHQLLQ